MRGWRLLAVLGMSLFLVAGCGDDPVTQPTPTPTPTPTPLPTPTPTPTPVVPAALDTLVIDPGSVEGQNTPTGTVNLTTAAPTGGAEVLLQSGNNDVAKVPFSVVVPAGSTTATFKVDTSTVPADRGVTIQATYLGVTKSFVLTVRPPALVARFNVTSGSRGQNACEIINAGGSIDCRLDASASGGFIGRYLWTLTVGTHDSSFPTGDSVYTPTTDCSHLTGGTLDNGTITMGIRLQVEDRNGATSTTNPVGVTLHTRGFCGY